MMVWRYSGGIYNRRDGTYNIRFRSDRPILVTSFRQTLHNVRLIPHKPQETHDFLTASPNPKYPVHLS